PLRRRRRRPARRSAYPAGADGAFTTGKRRLNRAASGGKAARAGGGRASRGGPGFQEVQTAARRQRVSSAAKRLWGEAGRRPASPSAATSRGSQQKAPAPPAPGAEAVGRCTATLAHTAGRPAHEKAPPPGEGGAGRGAGASPRLSRAACPSGIGTVAMPVKQK